MQTQIKQNCVKCAEKQNPHHIMFESLRGINKLH